MENLLNPELSVEDSGQSLYSSKALFFTAFLGGPMAVILLSAMNSRILIRLKTDIIMYIAAIILFILLTIGLNLVSYSDWR